MKEKVKEQPPRDWREARRLQAWKLKQKGWKQKDIAEALGVSEGAVSQWLKRAREGGAEALRSQPGPGAKPRLDQHQKQGLLALLALGAEAHGFRGEVWTQPRIAKLIRREFGVRYPPSQAGRIVKGLGWSRQKPQHRASQRDEAAIERWRTVEWDRIKKKLTTSSAR